MYPAKLFKKEAAGLTGMAQLGGCRPAKRKVPGLIPGQGTGLGCRPGPRLGHVRGNWSTFLLYIGVSLPLFLPPFPSL